MTHTLSLIKPLDIVTAKSDDHFSTATPDTVYTGLVTEVGSGDQSSVVWFNPPTYNGPKTAWWARPDLTIINNLPNILTHAMVGGGGENDEYFNPFAHSPREGYYFTEPAGAPQSIVSQPKLPPVKPLDIVRKTGTHDVGIVIQVTDYGNIVVAWFNGKISCPQRTSFAIVNSLPNVLTDNLRHPFSGDRVNPYQLT